MVAKTGGTVMKSRSSRSNISCTKTERKVVERNRRNQMKSLYSSLNSLLPNQNFKVLHLSLSLNSCLLVLFHSSMLPLTSHEEAKLSLLSCYCRQIIAFGLERFGIYNLRLDDISCSLLFLELAKLLKIFFLLLWVYMQEAQPLPDQIDRAINYIKSLEEKLEKAREKKESLARSRKRSYTCTFDPISSAASKSPQLKIHEIGSALEIVLTSGLGNQFLFYEIISILHEEGVEVVSANFQALGDSFFHIVHAQVIIIFDPLC
jgi:hypothetical protein